MAPSECVDGVPEDLDALCAALLARESRRPARRRRDPAPPRRPGQQRSRPAARDAESLESTLSRGPGAGAARCWRRVRSDAGRAASWPFASPGSRASASRRSCSTISTSSRRAKARARSSSFAGASTSGSRCPTRRSTASSTRSPGTSWSTPICRSRTPSGRSRISSPCSAARRRSHALPKTVAGDPQVLRQLAFGALRELLATLVRAAAASSSSSTTCSGATPTARRSSWR